MNILAKMIIMASSLSRKQIVSLLAVAVLLLTVTASYGIVYLDEDVVGKDCTYDFWACAV
jgi:hypothetical protein